MEVRIFSNTDIANLQRWIISLAVVQTTNQSFDFNGESSLDLEYGMGLTNPQPVTLLQVGDLVEGSLRFWSLFLPLTDFNSTQAVDLIIGWMLSMHRFAVEMIPHRLALSGLIFPYSLASPYNCKSFIQDGIYPDPLPGGFDGRYLWKMRSLNVIDWE